MRISGLFLLLALAALARSARAGELTEDLRQGALESPVGFGSSFGTDSGAASYALLIDGHHHFNQTRTIWGIRQYGFAESRLEAGNHVGASLDALSGITLIGLRAGRTIAPQLGIEPFSGRVTLSSLPSHLNYYEWNPMASAGIQAAIGTCRLLVVARGGAGLGDLALGRLGPELDPAIGPAGMINCRRVDFALSSTDVLRGTGTVALTTVDVLFQLRPRKAEIGLRGELTALDRPGLFPLDPANAAEKRVLLLFRGAVFGDL